MKQMLDWLAHRSAVSPEKIALIYEEQRLTYRELNYLVADMAGRLAVAGVEAGLHVGVLMPNRVETVCLIHALARLGAVLVPLNVRLTAAELRWQVEQADCNMVICAEETEAQAAPLLEPERPVLSVDPSQQPSGQFLNDLAGDAAAWMSRPLNLEAVQGIVFTSGTTGRPKGAMLTFANHFWSATASAYRLGSDPADRWLACMPLYHIGGIAIIFRCCLYGTTVVLHNGFDPAVVSHALKTQRISLISVVPTMLHRLLEDSSDGLTSSSLRCILVGGAAASLPLLEQCRKLNLPLAATYGLTEAASQVVTESPLEAGRKPGSVGKPLLFSEVRVVDEQDWETAPGEIGEIVVSGPTVMTGYYKNSAATQEILRNGQLHTGDMGYLDDDGDLWVVQRRADLIVSGGENIYPAEVEQVVRRHPAVKEVCVVGIEDAAWGQRVAAAIVVNPSDVTEQALIQFCRAQLAGYKQPRLIRFVAALPRTASGKVRRDEVRALIESGDGV